MNGRFIVIEGLDGTGKTTQIQRLAKNLQKNNISVQISAEPTPNDSGKLIRRILSGEIKSDPWSTAALFLADRITHNTASDGIKATTEKGTTVISDRYYFSTFAYQGMDTSLQWVMDIHYNCPVIRQPDLVLFLTMSAEKCIERITANRKAEEIEIFENTESLKKISSQFDKVFSMLKDKENIVYIDADGTIEDVEQRIFNAVKTIFPEVQDE